MAVKFFETFFEENPSEMEPRINQWLKEHPDAKFLSSNVFIDVFVFAYEYEVIE